MNHLTGTNLRLVRFTKEHVTDEYLGWLADEEVTRYLYVGRYPKCRENLVYASEADDRNLMFAVLTTDGEYIGTCSLHKHDIINRSAEIGYMIGSRKHWGKGLATELIGLLANYGFGRLNLHKLTAGVEGPNVGSSKALERNGFKQIAILPENYYLDGVYLDTYLYCKFQREHYDRPI
jgi:ribosomal-protein-alanine N-acetyltransferase